MMAVRRRLVFQLTPLLDLLLIVIFAQYMQVRQETTIATDQAALRIADAEQELLDARRRLEDLRGSSSAARNGRGELEEKLEKLESQTERLNEQSRLLQQQNVELGESLEQVTAQRDLVGRLATELFRLPDDLIERQILSDDSNMRNRSPEQLAELRETFRQMGRQRGSEMVKHLLTYAEMRKRSDIWDLYIGENGTIRFSTGETTLNFRAETAEEFQSRLFEAYKSLPEPKSLVIILLSYGNAKAVWRKAARDGLPAATSRMSADAGGDIRFEYAVLGYRPQQAEVP